MKFSFFIASFFLMGAIACTQQPKGLSPEQEEALAPHMGIIDSLKMKYEQMDSGMQAFEMLKPEELLPEIEEYYSFFASLNREYSRDFYMGPITRMDDLHRALSKSIKEYPKLKEQLAYNQKQVLALEQLFKQNPEKIDSLQSFINDELMALSEFEFIYYKRIYRSLNFAPFWPEARLQLDSAREAILSEKL